MSVGKEIYHFFWKVSGEDPQILADTKQQIKWRFLCSGIVVFFLFWLSVFSYHHSFNKLFKLPVMSWVIGFAFTMMIINIYRLNIITLASKELKYNFGYFVSLTIRVLFIILISLTVIKPLETIILDKIVSSEVEAYKEIEIKEALDKTTSYYDKEIAITEKELQELRERIEQKLVINAEGNEAYLINKLAFLKNDKASQLWEIKKLLAESPYFIRSLILINERHSEIWLLTICLMLFFLLPFILKFTTSPSGFYSRKRMILQDKIIEEEYQLFKQYYPNSFYSSIGEVIEVVERFVDPPYNTIKIKDERVIGVESDFIKYLYGDKKD